MELPRVASDNLALLDLSRDEHAFIIDVFNGQSIADIEVRVSAGIRLKNQYLSNKEIIFEMISNIDYLLSKRNTKKSTNVKVDTSIPDQPNKQDYDPLDSYDNHVTTPSSDTRNSESRRKGLLALSEILKSKETL